MDKSRSVLVVGFNTRPLAYSLHQAEYKVYAVDFFGDIDLFPYVEDSIIVIDELKKRYGELKESYSKYLVDFTLEMIDKHESFEYLLIGSGLDDAYKGRKLILDKIKEKSPSIINLNNKVDVIKKARDIEKVYQILGEHGDTGAPRIFPFKIKKSGDKKTVIIEDLPDSGYIVLKKKRSSGGSNIFKINCEQDVDTQLEELDFLDINHTDWIFEEFISGKPISCTIIANGDRCQVISINSQIIGELSLNSPREFMYCGNTVPESVMLSDEIDIIASTLVEELKLIGINGLDFVYDGYPYLMEINPRIPGSLRVSEEALDLNLLKLHIDSFNPEKWHDIVLKLKSRSYKWSATKLIYFSPKEITSHQLKRINKLEHIHDKTAPEKGVSKGEPVCTILYKAICSPDSLLGAYKVVEKINEILNEK